MASRDSISSAATIEMDILAEESCSFGHSSSNNPDTSQTEEKYGNDTQQSLARFTPEGIAEKRNTVRKTQHDVFLLQTFLEEQYQEKRPILEISPSELNDHLVNFFLNIKMKDGRDYEPGSLRSLYASFERYLQANNFGGDVSIVYDDQFKQARDTLKLRQKFLKQQGKGKVKPYSKSQVMSEALGDVLYKEGVLGMHNPLALHRTLWWILSWHFGIKTCQEHHNLRWGSIIQGTTEQGKHYLEYNDQYAKTQSATIKTRVSGTSNDPEDPRDPVSVFRCFAAVRPVDMCFPEAPLYLSVRKTPGVWQGGSHEGSYKWSYKWFKSLPLGINSLTGMLKSLLTDAGITEADAVKLGHNSSYQSEQQTSTICEQSAANQASSPLAMTKQHGQTKTMSCIDSPAFVPTVRTLPSTTFSSPDDVTKSLLTSDPVPLKLECTDETENEASYKIVPRENFNDHLCESLRIFWEEEMFCDATIQTQDQELKVHSLVLAAVSPRFQCIMAKGGVKCLAKLDLAGDAVKAVLDFIYGGDLKLTLENVREIHKAAKFLSIKYLVDQCQEFMDETSETKMAMPVAVRRSGSMMQVPSVLSERSATVTITSQTATAANFRDKAIPLHIHVPSGTYSESNADSNCAQPMTSKRRKLLSRSSADSLNTVCVSVDSTKRVTPMYGYHVVPTGQLQKLQALQNTTTASKGDPGTPKQMQQGARTLVSLLPDQSDSVDLSQSVMVKIEPPSSDNLIGLHPLEKSP